MVTPAEHVCLAALAAAGRCHSSSLTRPTQKSPKKCTSPLWAGKRRRNIVRCSVYTIDIYIYIVVINIITNGFIHYSWRSTWTWVTIVLLFKCSLLSDCRRGKFDVTAKLKSVPTSQRMTSPVRVARRDTFPSSAKVHKCSSQWCVWISDNPAKLSRSSFMPTEKMHLLFVSVVGHYRNISRCHKRPLKWSLHLGRRRREPREINIARNIISWTLFKHVHLCLFFGCCLIVFTAIDINTQIRALEHSTKITGQTEIRSIHETILLYMYYQRYSRITFNLQL